MQRHPFDPQHSGRDPFPCFDAAMALPPSTCENSDLESDENDTGGCACDGACSGGRCTSTSASLDWSIDGLATLWPRAFSPLAYQFHTTPLQLHALRRRRRWSTGTTASIVTSTRVIAETPLRSSTFFDDEAEFCILRTPTDVIAHEQQTPQSAMAIGVPMTNESEYAKWRAAPESAMRWRDLHRRCVDTIQLCEARLRERQQRLAQLPIPATKLKLKRRGRWSDIPTKTPSPPVRIPREPLTPVIPTRLSFGSLDLSPIPLDHTPIKLSSTESQSSRPPGFDSVDTNRSVFSSPALSSIAEHTADVLTPSFQSLQFSPSRDVEEEEKEDKENTLQTSPPGSSSSSLKSMPLLRTSPSAVASSTSSSFSVHDDDAMSITERQQSFIAAIEEEAQARDAAIKKTKTTLANDSATEESESDATAESVRRHTTPDSTKKTPLRCPTPATSTTSIYKEARALGLTEPTAQWEYVQLIRRQTTRERTSRASL